MCWLAEKEVTANKEPWPLVVKTVGNDLQQVYARVTDYNSKVVESWKNNGITDRVISVRSPTVRDKEV